MAQLVIDFPDSIRNRVLDAFASTYGYQATLQDGTPNPQTKAQFAKAQVARFVKEVVKGYEATRAGEIARKAAHDAAENEITPT